MRLIEGDATGLLFHSTTVDAALRIIASGTIRGTPTHVGHESGVSLTRSFNFAQYWRDGIMFVLDTDKLKSENHLVPIQWRPHHGEANPGDEQETFAYGSIALADTLVSINIGNPFKIEPSKWETPERVAQWKTKLAPLLTHPKLNAWQPVVSVPKPRRRRTLPSKGASL
jgi:hypothetical protein